MSALKFFKQGIKLSIDTAANNNSKIISSSVENAANSMLELSTGIHALVVYSDRSKLRELWSFYTKKSIEENDGVVYLAPFYDTIDCVRNALSEGKMAIDVGKYEKEEKPLIIKDSLEKYYEGNTNVFNVKFVLKTNHELIEYAKTLDKKHVSVLGDLGAFFFKDQIQNLMDYESSLPIEFEDNLRGICLYHQMDFDRLSIGQQNSILDRHKIALKI